MTERRDLPPLQAIDKLGLLNLLGSLVEDGIADVAPDYRLLAAMMMILWVSARDRPLQPHGMPINR